MLNATHLFSKTKEEHRYNCSPYLGFGWAYVADSPSAGSLAGSLGVLQTYSLDRNWLLNLDLRGTLVGDGLDGEKGGRKGEGLFTGTIGVTYIFR